MTPSDVIREMIQREKFRWRIKHAMGVGLATEHQQWVLYLDGEMFGVWPDANFVVRVRDMHVLWGVMSAAISDGKAVLSREQAVAVSRFIDESEGSSPVCRLRPVLVQRIEDRVFRKMEV